MPRGGLRNPPGGRPVGSIGAPRRALRAAAAAYGLRSIQALGDIVDRALAEDGEKGALAPSRPKDSDTITAADKLLGWGYGRPATDKTIQGFVGAYDMSKLSDEQVRTVTEILRIAAPAGSMGETD